MFNHNLKISNATAMLRSFHVMDTENGDRNFDILLSCSQKRKLVATLWMASSVKCFNTGRDDSRQEILVFINISIRPLPTEEFQSFCMVFVIVCCFNTFVNIISVILSKL